MAVTAVIHGVTAIFHSAAPIKMATEDRASRAKFTEAASPINFDSKPVSASASHS
jgi:hypothetical protein